MPGDAVAAATGGRTATATPDEAAVVTDGSRADDDRRPGGRWQLAVVVALVAVAASPIVVGALSYVGDTWHVAGDWAHFVHRVSQVGTSETPLVGSYTVKGWAHPGPFGFWLAAPLYRLTGEDPRALLWTGALVHVAMLAALAAVAWRRGRWPLVLGVVLLAAVLVRGIGPQYLVDLWNPYLPLTAFLLVLLLAWDAALGRRRALLEAVIPAALAMQSHLAFVSLVGLVTVWLVAWSIGWPRLLGVAGPARAAGHESDDPPGADGSTRAPGAADPDSIDTTGVEALPRPPWGPWLRTARWVALGSVVLWLPALADALFDLHNPWNIARSFGSDTARLGVVEGVGLVGRYVRPDGPWMGGPEPTGGDFFSIQGSGALPVVVAVAVLLVCIQLARRSRLVDVTALATLTLVLVVGAVPAVAQFPLPAERYLTQWLKVVGGLVWFTVAWTAWRLLAPRLRTVRARQAVAGVVAAGIVVVAATTWGKASSIDLPLDDRGRHVQALVSELEEELPRDQTIRVERRGEFFHVYTAGVFYELMQDGYDVVTEEGSRGLKWGHDHRWSRGEPYDVLVTVAVNQAYLQCSLDGDARLLASYDDLSPEDRAWLDEVQLRRLEDADTVTAEESRRAEALADDAVRVGVFEGARPCARDDDNEVTRSTDSSIVPVLAAIVGLGLAAAGGHLLWRRRQRTGTSA